MSTESFMLLTTKYENYSAFDVINLVYSMIKMPALIR